MKKTIIALSTTLSILLLSGCGGGADSDASQIKKQPHNTSKLNRTASEYKDWSWNVGLEATSKKIDTSFYSGYPDAMEHFQYFIDSDNDANTGFSGSGTWEIYGADYLIEDSYLFKYLPNSTEDWKWEYIREVDVDHRDSGELKTLTIQNSKIPLADTINIMIELYDANWDGDYPTVTGLETKLENQRPDNDNASKKVTRIELDVMIANGEDYSKVDVSGITDMSGLFSLKDVKYDITGWDVSNVTNMNKMFGFTDSFNQPIGNWDVSNVTNMSYMFQDSKLFNQPIENWDVSSVKNMGSMFRSAALFNQPIGNWDVSNVTDMGRNDTDHYNRHGTYGMFYYAKSFNQNISTWDVSNVIFYRSFSLFSPLKEEFKPHFVNGR